MCRSASNAGFSLISAIFLIVVLSALGLYMVQFSTVQSLAAVQDMEGARGYQAAMAGTEYGVYRILQSNTCGTTNLGFPDPGLNGWAVTVTCTSAGPYTDGSTFTLYRIVATACNRPSAGACPGTPDGRIYVERRLTTTLRK